MPKEYTTPPMSTYTYYRILYDEYSYSNEEFDTVEKAKDRIKQRGNPCRLFLVTEVLTELDIEKI